MTEVVDSSINPSQVAHIIETLKQDLPTLFEKEVSYDIYSSDIAFKDPVNTFKGKLSYRIVFWTLLFHGYWFFTHLSFELHEVCLTSADTIRADWTVQGRLRLPWRTQLIFNGYSIYRLNSAGLIYDHVDTWDRPPLEILKQFFRPVPKPTYS